MSKIEIFHPVSGSYDVTVLQQYADNPTSYFGKIIYLAKITGSAVTVYPFVQPGKFYFNEVGTWHVSQNESYPSSSGYDND